MVTQAELNQVVLTLFATTWSIRQSHTVPLVQNLGLAGNDGVKLDACVLYADLTDSTGLVDAYPAAFAAEIYKAYMHCAGKIIRDAGGSITAYDGDRVMAIFIGPGKEDASVKAALRLQYLIYEILWPALATCYPKVTYRPHHTVSVDSSELLAVRIGVRSGNDIGNDIVWVGRAANHAAKLCAENIPEPVRVTVPVWSALSPGILTYNGQTIWRYHGPTPAGAVCFASNWWFNLWYDP